MYNTRHVNWYQVLNLPWSCCGTVETATLHQFSCMTYQPDTPSSYYNVRIIALSWTATTVLVSTVESEESRHCLRCRLLSDYPATLVVDTTTGTRWVFTYTRRTLTSILVSFGYSPLCLPFDAYGDYRQWQFLWPSLMFPCTVGVWGVGVRLAWRVVLFVGRLPLVCTIRVDMVSAPQQRNIRAFPVSIRTNVVLKPQGAAI